MDIPFILMVVFRGLIFLAWSIQAFRWLLAIRADAVAESGVSLPGLKPTLCAFRGGLFDPKYSAQRLRLGALTILLLALSLLAPLTF